MATWQYDMHLIPKRALVERFGVLPSHLPRKEWESSEWWLLHPPPDEFESLIAKRLAPAEPWATDVSIWGPVDETCVHAVFEVQGLVELMVRVDLRTADSSLLTWVCSIAKRLKSVFRTAEGELLLPTKAVLADRMLRSPAARFLRDPHALLSGMGSGGPLEG